MLTEAVLNLAKETDPLNKKIQIRPLNIDLDVPVIHPWYQMDYASFWNMQHLNLEQTKRFYAEGKKSKTLFACIGLYEGKPAFVMEYYPPQHEEVGKHYPVQSGDIGMHFFVGPAEKHIPNFTRDVIRSVMAYLFFTRHAKRVVVEPDVKNKKVHKLNLKVGFKYDRIIQLAEKEAYLAFCSVHDFLNTLDGRSTL
ncbi:GNAT family N-acetyltransferase [Teredinibacter sp. KSP-S5-2]|uniref:GNAT family N-acetyltransferase n=1 Tax=Teredinibacter sp. KSP-S5-2 TaxID=3034506 RepID=UPI002934F614|nr:GNAT family N-acetyltransferase [Teredinibacter sp. KSP-S5-2]WNO08278.1 GNAT family N-acetyltransferase [Teredinibacter sp. KSP-S5-2]